MKSISIELPIPSRAIHPHSRVHHMARAKATKAARTSAHIRALDATGNRRLNLKSATLRAEWHFRVQRTRDDDRLTGWLAAYRDGLADAGIVANDSAFAMAGHTVGIDRNFPRVVLTVEGAQ